jgi:hypothetical protein
MSKFEIKKLFEFRKSRYLPCGLNIRDQLWWRFVPGVVINVKWPVGEVVVGPSSRNWSGMGPMYEEIFSTDPNDHYRPWMEKHVGKQGWDWDWGMADRDATENRLTIKIRRKHQDYAILAKLQWS